VVGWGIDWGVVRASAEWVIGSHSLGFGSILFGQLPKSLVLRKNLAPRGPRTGHTYNPVF
jgi:hypothetical protein